MFLDLMINGELKMTAEVDVENLKPSQWKRQVCKLLNVSFSEGTWRYNLVSDKKYFDIILPEKMVSFDGLAGWSEGECVSIIDQEAVCIGVIKK